MLNPIINRIWWFNGYIGVSRCICIYLPPVRHLKRCYLTTQNKPKATVEHHGGGSQEVHPEKEAKEIVGVRERQPYPFKNEDGKDDGEYLADVESSVSSVRPKISVKHVTHQMDPTKIVTKKQMICITAFESLSWPTTSCSVFEGTCWQLRFIFEVNWGKLLAKKKR